MSPSLTILSQPDKGTITLIPNDSFRWTAQKLIWESNKLIGEVIGIKIRGRLKKSTLDANNVKLDYYDNLLIDKLVEMGFTHNLEGYSPAKGMLNQICGAITLREVPKDRQKLIEYIKDKIQNARRN